MAIVNRGNDLAALIRDEAVGKVCESHDVSAIRELLAALLDEIETDELLAQRCRDLFRRNFSVSQSVKQIVAAFERGG